MLSTAEPHWRLALIILLTNSFPRDEFPFRDFPELVLFCSPSIAESYQVTFTPRCDGATVRRLPWEFCVSTDAANRELKPS